MSRVFRFDNRDRREKPEMVTPISVQLLPPMLNYSLNRQIWHKKTLPWCNNRRQFPNLHGNQERNQAKSIVHPYDCWTAGWQITFTSLEPGQELLRRKSNYWGMFHAEWGRWASAPVTQLLQPWTDSTELGQRWGQQDSCASSDDASAKNTPEVSFMATFKHT